MFTPAQLSAVLQEKGLKLFHFTDGRNVHSIKESGLLSTYILRERGIATVTGGDDDSLGIDRYRGFDRYVRLSFCKNHPMEYRARMEGRIEGVRKLRIDPSVMVRDGVMVSDRLATANDARVLPIADIINDLDIEATYGQIDWKVPENLQRRKAAEKWEILVPDEIGPQLIAGI